MKKRISIYGTGYWANKLADYAENWKISIEYFVNSQMCETGKFRRYNVILPEEIEWENIDYLIISSDKYYESIISSLTSRNMDYFYNQEKVVKIEEGFDLIHKNDSDFSVVKLGDGTNYLYRATDKCIGPLMRCTGSTYSQEIIDRFINYVNCMHDDSENGIFLDIGANIGTTSIYVKKKLSNIKIIGFEPGKENYDIFRINCILNQIDDIVIEKLALSDCEDMKYFHLCG